MDGWVVGGVRGFLTSKISMEYDKDPLLIPLYLYHSEGANSACVGPLVWSG